MDPASPKDYPRASDPANDAWLKVTNVTTNTFEVNVGKSPIVGHEASAGSYDAATGDLVLNLGPHSLTPGTAIKIAKESLALVTEDLLRKFSEINHILSSVQISL